MASLVRQIDIECDDERGEDLNYQARLHCLSVLEELVWYDFLTPYGQTQYDGACFWD